MKPNTIRALLDSGEPTVATRIMIGDPLVVEVVGKTGMFDYVEFLAEYAAYDLRSLEEFCRAAELSSLGSMIKVDWENRSFVAQRAVGAGFDSVLFADSRSAEDARNCVSCLQPDTPEHGGTFGAAARRHALPGYGGTPRYVEALDEVVVALMIEKASAVESLDEILAVGGIDMIQWGPSDYAMSIGRAGEQDSKVVRDAERRVLSACLDAGIPARAEIRSPEEAGYYLDLGVRHFNLGIDLFTLHDVLKQGGEQLREIVGAAL